MKSPDQYKREADKILDGVKSRVKAQVKANRWNQRTLRLGTSFNAVLRRLDKAVQSARKEERQKKKLKQKPQKKRPIIHFVSRKAD